MFKFPIFRVLLLVLSFTLFGSMLSLNVQAQVNSNRPSIQQITEQQMDFLKTQVDVGYIQVALKENKEIHDRLLEKIEKNSADLSTIRGIGMGFGALMGLVQLMQIFLPAFGTTKTKNRHAS